MNFVAGKSGLLCEVLSWHACWRLGQFFGLKHGGAVLSTHRIGEVVWYAIVLALKTNSTHNRYGFRNR
jgi:hypothetical protein